MNSFLMLNNKQLDVYNAVYSSIVRGKTDISINYSGEIDDLLNIVKIVLAENAEFFQYDNCYIQYLKQGRFCKKIILSKWVNDLHYYSLQSRFKLCADNIINQVIHPKMNDIQKALAIHNYLVNNVRYIDGTHNPTITHKLHTAYGAIVEKESVCEGISAAFCYLLKRLGVPVTIVNGETSRNFDIGHCWNIIKAKSDYYHIDVTWDLKNKNRFDYTCLDYFSVTDQDLSNRHWKKEWYPKCYSNSMNFFYLTKSIAQTPLEFISIAKRQINKNHALYIKFDIIKQFRTETEAFNYIVGLIQNDSGLSTHMLGTLSGIINLEQATVYIKCFSS